jgi:hypothetical protein
MTTKSSNAHEAYTVELKNDGVYLLFETGGKKRIADMIIVTALGTGLQDDAAYTIIKFQDKDGKKKIEVVPTSLLTAGTKDFIKRMTDAHYIWPEARAHRERLVAALSVQNPASRIAVTVVPGWHEVRYVLPDMIALPKGDDWTCHFYRNDNVLLPNLVRSGESGWLAKTRREKLSDIKQASASNGCGVCRNHSPQGQPRHFRFLFCR